MSRWAKHRGIAKRLATIAVRRRITIVVGLSFNDNTADPIYAKRKSY